MSALTMAEVICMALFCCLLGPTLGLSSPQGLDSGRTRRGLFGGGGVLSGLLGGGDKGGGGGLPGGILGGGGKGVLGGVLGGDEGKGGGLLGGVLGGKGDGLLGGVGGLLNSTSNGVLPGVGGLLNQSLLVNLLTGQNVPFGLTDALSLLGLGNGGAQEPFRWDDILKLQFIRGSWKILRGTELILNLRTRIIVKLPGMLFRTVTVDVNTTADLAITQDKAGELKLVLKNCRSLTAGIAVKLPPGLIALLVSNVVNSAFQNTLPEMLCPIFQAWLKAINAQLRTLNDVSFGVLGQIHSALRTLPTFAGFFSELDLKGNPFLGYFFKWLIRDVTDSPKMA
ncbi:BPI fold-containing family B member 4-like [Ahaetulla prasina]|uniref:BPI fold-containing family B member 4-like n=1 Tax=Ahaetulla prasina TaxID=499056 RepID=UPI002649CE17|nr:BPI fold-containing family B member 4-like [Ahaetulla prasina]